MLKYNGKSYSEGMGIMSKKNEKIEKIKEYGTENITKILSNTSEIELANKVACVTFSILVTIISIAYIVEVIKGNRSITYVAITCILGYIPVIACLILYPRNKETALLKHLIAIGFIILYTFLLFTAHNDLVFTYVIPLLIVVTLYNDFKYTIMLSIGVIIENIVCPVYNIYTNDINKDDIVTMEIQILLMIMVVGFFLAVSYTSTKFQMIKVSQINDEKNKISTLLDRTLSLSDNMSDSTVTISSQMETLRESVNQTISSMSEVNSGTNETAEAIQNQLIKTAEIQKYIDNVSNVSKEISNDVNLTSSSVHNGQNNISKLIQLNKQSKTAGENVADALQKFKGYTDKMNSITDLITEVASQTSLLSLNASIEAARAGEAGRGFAVVASEISSLADQTKTATDDITEIINNISNQLSTMIGTISNLIDINIQQNLSAENTATSFTYITKYVETIQFQSHDLNEIVSKLSISNKAIVDNIQTISAITEEVSAHSNETYSSSERNRDIVAQVDTLIKALNEDSKKFQEYK